MPVSEEIEALENYISLQAMQSGGSFSYSISAYDGYQDDDKKIPPMLLQPFVEDAILHVKYTELFIRPDKALQSVCQFE